MRHPAEDKRTGHFTIRPLLSLSSFVLAIVVGLISSFTFSAAYDMARGALATEPARVAGVWHGHWNGVHAVTLKLEQGCDSLQGTARFSKVIDTGDGLKVIGESEPLRLVNPELSGDKLTFQVEDTSSCLTTVFTRLEMRFTKPGEAELRREQEQEEAGVITMLLERSF
jgi:hypothetical protein